MAADLANGISNMAVEAVNKVNTAIKEEAEQWQSVHRDLVFIKDEFQMMESFLNSANGERVRTTVARTWLRQVRELSYDFEDCIEAVLHLDPNKRSWWLRLLPSCCCSKDCIETVLQLDANKRPWWLRLLPSCCCCKEGVALPVDDVATEIKQLKARVVEVSERNTRYGFIREDSDSQSLTGQQFVAGSAIGATGFDVLVEARDTAARYAGAVDLTKLITEKSNDRRVISVWGTDDLWTMSVIRNIYDDSRIYEKFGCRAWVKMMHPMDPHEFIRSLVFQFYANSFHEHDSTVGIHVLSWICKKLKKQRDALSWTEASIGALIKEFLRHISAHRYLIILEDLSTVAQWDAIRPYLRDSKNGSRVVVSTRYHEIASLCTGKPCRVLELQRISANQSICIFFNAGLASTEERVLNSVPQTYDVSCWLDKNHLFGRESEINKLLNLIKDPRGNHVVSVWGIPGSGRTALVTNVYYRCFGTKQFDCQAIISMPQPYSLTGFCRCLLLAPGLASRSSQCENPIKQCQELLHKCRCLVVIDEMTSTDEWDSINDAQLVSPGSNSCIVVITAEESVAIHCAKEDNLVCSIKCLQATSAYDLFRQAFQKQGHSSEYIYRPSMYENFIFGTNGEEEVAFMNDGISSEGATFQNDENSASQNNVNPCNNAKLFRSLHNNGNSFEEYAVKNKGKSIQEEEIKNNGNGKSFEGHAVQNKGKSIQEQEIQNNGKSFEEQVFQKYGLSEGHQLQDNENLFKEQIFQNNGKSFQAQAPSREQAFQNNGKSLEGQICQNTGNLFEQALRFALEMNNLVDHSFQIGGSSFEEPAFQDNGSSFEGQTSQNILDQSDQQTFQNNENSYEELSSESEGSFEDPDQNKTKLMQEIFQNENVREEQTFQKIKVSISWDNPTVKAILSRSGGLPKVIVALGRYLGNQHMSDMAIWELHCQRLITNFMQELQTCKEFDCLRGLFAWMRSYISSCGPSLMRSMLYLIIFPRGETFRRRRLTRRWVAEGYAKSTESNSLEEEAASLFHKLASQNVLQQATLKTMDERYEVNGFFHEYIISRPMENKIFFPLEVSILDRYCRLTTGAVGQHLTIWSSWDRNKKVAFDSLDFSRLRSLTVFGQWEKFFISDKMRVLRVLDLENANAGGVTDVDLDNIGKFLLRLKFLSLRGCKLISHLPDSFGRLSQLQTLDIRDTKVKELRPSITKLRKLQYVRAGNTVPMDDNTRTVESQPLPPPGVAYTTAVPSSSTPLMSRPRAATLVSRFRLPESWTRRRERPACSHNGGVTIGVVVAAGLGQMIALHTLGVIDVSVANWRAILRDLKNLTQLRKLGVSGVNWENCQELCSAISGHTYLKSLSVWFDKGNSGLGCLDAICCPPKDLESLGLYGHEHDKLPEWIKTLQFLNKLKLHMARKAEGGNLQFRDSFDTVRLLEIGCNNGLQAVTFDPGAMCNIEVLKLRCQDVSPSLHFSGLKQLQNLAEVSLSGCYSVALKKHLETELAEHPREMKPILTEW